MGYSFIANIVSYIIIERRAINKGLEPKIQPGQSVAEWVRLHVGQQVFPAINDDHSIFENEKFCSGFFGECSDEEDEGEDADDEYKDRAVIVLSEIRLDCYKGGERKDSDKFRVSEYAKLFENPREDLHVVTDVNGHVSI